MSQPTIYEWNSADKEAWLLESAVIFREIADKQIPKIDEPLVLMADIEDILPPDFILKSLLNISIITNNEVDEEGDTAVFRVTGRDHEDNNDIEIELGAIIPAANQTRIQSFDVSDFGSITEIIPLDVALDYEVSVAWNCDYLEFKGLNSKTFPLYRCDVWNQQALYSIGVKIETLAEGADAGVSVQITTVPRRNKDGEHVEILEADWEDYKAFGDSASINTAGMHIGSIKDVPVTAIRLKVVDPELKCKFTATIMQQGGMF